MEQKNVFVQVLYPFCGFVLPGLNLYKHDMEYIKSRSYHLRDEGCYLVEYVNGVRTSVCEVSNGQYKDLNI